ncbi:MULTISPECIES: ATP-binding protein [Pseudanabaena]|uniref:AAA ATPase n=2 Tax=Pseudanabaena TaxID=1152 RepID=L8MVA5_9CYAN|nr:MULTISPECIES: ATP-binding protein [Pseudanabaena]ELS31877.1 AAA ATPase [Pseudanabaena biceps PCC 7429]MDG3495875.1 ATP-binding protein [Pseudanabaena catenata USMAC16]
MTYSFQQATKENIKLRMALYGPPGCGKTYTALQLATMLGKKIGLIDTEYGSSRKYAKLFNFQVLELTKFGPSQYYNAIESAEEVGFDYLIIDSLSHAWYAELDSVGSDVRNWAKVRPIERQLWDKIISSKCHIIATMRSKIEYDYSTAEVGGKQKITSVRKIGTAPIQKEGSEYELDICGLLDDQNTLTISKSRCPEISNGIFPKPGKKFAEMIQTWLSDEAPVPNKALIPMINVPINPVAQQPQVQELATVASSNGHIPQKASTNGHLATVVETQPTITHTQPSNSKPDNPAKAAFKALLAITQQNISKVIEASIDLYGADESGTKPKFNSENMTAEQIKAVCEALMKEWLGLKGYTSELAQNLIEISTSRHPGQYAEIAKDIASQLEF